MAGNMVMRAVPGTNAYLGTGETLMVVRGATLGLGQPDMVQVRDDEGMPLFETSVSALLTEAGHPQKPGDGLARIIAVEIAADQQLCAIIEINKGYTSVRVPFDYAPGK